MAGRGTGIPIAFKCPVERREDNERNFWLSSRPRRDLRDVGPRPKHTKVRTGRTKPAPHRNNLPPRKLRDSHEYRCSCGHVGWSCHSGVLRAPLETETAGT